MGLLGQLQSQLITTNHNIVQNNQNLPESWKVQNQLTRSAKKEKKFNLKKKRKQQKKIAVNTAS